MSKRINELDYVRVIAISMILLCHYLECSSVSLGLGRYLGGAGNTVFFVLSALLYSFRYCPDNQLINRGGQSLDTQRFAKGRILKLGSSVWPFLIVVTVLYLVFGVDFSWSKLGLNFVFLGYFGKMPGINHLWFLTVLMACYAEFVFLLRFRTTTKWFPWVFLGLMIGLMAFAETVGVPGLAFGYMGFFGFVFLKGRWLYEKSKALKIWQALIIVAINAGCIWLCCHELFETSRILFYLLTDICGLSLLVLMLRYLPDKSSKAISFLSEISFEIYLVHLNLCTGPFVKITSWNYNHLLQFSLVVALSILLAMALHYVAGLVEKPLAKVLKMNKQ